MVSTDVLRGELRKANIQLWLPPYTNADNDLHALRELAKTLSESLGGEPEAIEDGLEELRQHALAKLRAKTRVTLLGKVVGGAIPEVRVEFDESVTGGHVLNQLRDAVGTPELRVIKAGRMLREESTLQEQGWCADQARGGKPLHVLVLSSRSRAADDSKVGEAGKATSSVASVRDAAERLTAEGYGDFELTDAATGRNVSVPPSARQALIAAIALHARGREILGDAGRGGAAGALEFLAEADHCFEKCRDAGAIQLVNQLANFGQLQLDICWAYALLGDTVHLPDAESRLEASQRMISRQVDRNFLTLAEVKAEQGHTLPPEVIPSMRLWLLQGVAKRCRGNPEARKDLDRASLFLSALKVDAAAVDSLMTLGATRAQAVAALRRNGGSADRAGADLLAAAPQREAATREREEQQKLGQTADGSYLDLQKLAQLTSIGIRKELAIAALKQANNDLDAALDAVQTQPASALLPDERKAKKRKPATSARVDDLALATVLSMGFDPEASQEALLAHNNNVEEAVASLSMQQGATFSSGDSKASSSDSEGDKPHNDDSSAVKKAALDAAREVIERELGSCLRGSDLDDSVAGASFEEEEALLQEHLSCL